MSEPHGSCEPLWETVRQKFDRTLGREFARRKHVTPLARNARGADLAPISSPGLVTAQPVRLETILGAIDQSDCESALGYSVATCTRPARPERHSHRSPLRATMAAG